MTALAMAGALALVAGACGGNDDTADAESEQEKEAPPAAATANETAGNQAAGGSDFCQSAKALYDQLATANPGAPTSPQVKEVFDEARALEAPEEIASDWSAILDQLVAPVVNGDINTSDAAGTAELTRRAATLAESLQRTGTYFDTTCGFGPEASTPTTAGPAPTTAPTTVAPPG